MEYSICDVLRDLVSFVQIKKREKHTWRSVTFNTVTLLHGYFSRFLIEQIGTKSRNASHIIIKSFFLKSIFWCNGFTKGLFTLQCNTSFNKLFPQSFLQWSQIAAMVCLFQKFIHMLHYHVRNFVSTFSCYGEAGRCVFNTQSRGVFKTQSNIQDGAFCENK